MPLSRLERLCRESCQQAPQPSWQRAGNLDEALALAFAAVQRSGGPLVISGSLWLVGRGWLGNASPPVSLPLLDVRAWTSDALGMPLSWRCESR